MKEAFILNKHVLIQGFKNVRIENVDAFIRTARKETNRCIFQLFEADLIAGYDHLYFAVLHALKASERKVNISKDSALETLLYASGQLQISKAIDILGVKPSSSRIAVLVIAEKESDASESLKTISELLNAKRCDEVIEMKDEKVKSIKDAFGIGNLEIEATLARSEKEALSNLLIERTALIAAQV